MASNDLLMRIQLLVDAGKASAQLKQVSAELRRLNTEVSNIRNVRLTGLADDLSKLRTQLVAARNINLAPLNTQLAGFKSQLLASTTASAGLSNNIKSINNLTTALKQVRIQPIAEQIKNANAAFSDTSKLNLTPLQNNLRGVEQRLLQSKISAQQAKIAINALKEANPNAAVPQNLKDTISQYKKDLPALKNEIDKAKLAISQETSSLASNKQALILANQARRAAIATIQAQISANNASVLGLKQRLITEQSNAAQIKNNIGLTQAQITSQKNASIATQQSLQLQIAQKQQEVVATKSLLASRIAELKSNEDLARGELGRTRATNGIANQARQVRLLGGVLKQGTGALRQFGSALAFALGPQIAGFTAATAIFTLVHAFAQTNKEVENLRRGLNSISDFGGVLFSDLNDIADRTGQSIVNVSDSFLQLTASAQGTNLEGASTRQIFEAVSNALVITGADAVRSRRAFLALAQMMSKGQVYAEELRQQLSEALPGAVNIFSRALDVPPSKLLDLMKQGKVSSDALILFMEELKRTYKPIPQDLFTMSQKAALLQNSMLRLFTAIGDTGIWRSFGNSLVSAKNYIDNITSGVAEFSDNITITYEYLKKLDSIVGVFSTIYDAMRGLSSASSGASNEIYSIIATLPETLSRVIIELKSLISNAGLKLDIPVTLSTENSLLSDFNKFDKQWTENVYALAGKAGKFISDIFNQPYTIPTFEEFTKGNGILAKIQSRLGIINDEIQTLNDKSERFGGLNQYDSKKLDDLNEKLITTKNEYDNIYNANLSRYNSFVAQKENENKLVQRNVENARKEQDAITKAGLAYESSKKNAAILRDLNQSSLPIFSSIQRSVEQITNISKANEKSQLNKIEALREEQKIEDDIFDINQKQKKSNDDALKNRLADSRTLLELEVERGNALKEAEQNAKTLSEGRAKAGIYFTPEQRKASDDEEKARQLKIKALDIIEQANKSNSEIEKRALRDNAKYLLDQSNELYKSAGNAYALGQGLDEVKKILEANSKSSENDLNNTQAKLKAEREYGQAVKFFQDAEKSNVGSLAAEYRKYALEKAKSAAAGFADIGNQSKVDELNALLIKISEKNLQVSTELDDKIQAALARSKKEVDPELVIRQLGDLTGLLDQYKKAYANALSDPNTQKGVLDNFKEKITSINNDLLRLTENLSGTQFATQLPATIDTKAIEDGVKKAKDDIKKDSATLNVDVSLNSESKAKLNDYVEGVKTLWNNALESIKKNYNEAELHPSVNPKDIDKKEADAIREKLSSQIGVIKLTAAIESNNVDIQNAKLISFNSEIDNAQQSLQKPLVIHVSSDAELDTKIKYLNELNKLSGKKYEIQIEATQNGASDITVTPKANLDPLKQQFNVIKASFEAPENQPTLTPIVNSQSKKDFSDYIRSASKDSLAQTDSGLKAITDLWESQGFKVGVDFVIIGGNDVNGWIQNKEQRRRLSIEPDVSKVGPALENVIATAVDNSKKSTDKVSSNIDNAIRSVDPVVPVELNIANKDKFISNSSEVAKEFTNTLIDKLDDGFKKQGVSISIDEATASDLDGWKRSAQRLTATQKGLTFPISEFSASAKTWNDLVANGNKYMELKAQLIPDSKQLSSVRDDLQASLKDTPVSLDLSTLQPFEKDIIKELEDAGATGIKAIRDEAGNLKVSIDSSTATQQAQDLVDYFNQLNPTLHVSVVYDDPGFTANGSSTDAVKRALGGSIPGYGGGDRVRALLEPGEFVLRKEAVRSIGLDQLVQMNRLGYRSTARSVDNLAIPRFAGGGSVSGTPFVINIGGRSAINGHVSNRDQAKALADILTKSARSL